MVSVPYPKVRRKEGSDGRGGGPMAKGDPHKVGGVGASKRRCIGNLNSLIYRGAGREGGVRGRKAGRREGETALGRVLWICSWLVSFLLRFELTEQITSHTRPPTRG